MGHFVAPDVEGDWARLEEEPDHPHEEAHAEEPEGGAAPETAFEAVIEAEAECEEGDEAERDHEEPCDPLVESGDWDEERGGGVFAEETASEFGFAVAGAEAAVSGFRVGGIAGRAVAAAGDGHGWEDGGWRVEGGLGWGGGQCGGGGGKWEVGSGKCEWRVGRGRGRGMRGRRRGRARQRTMAGGIDIAGEE